MRNVLLNLLFPRATRCLVCGDPRRAGLEDGLCPSCRQKLAEEKVPAASCDVCLTRLEKGGPCPFCDSGGMEHIHRAYAPYRYMPASRKLVKTLKFDGSDEALPLLCDAMADALPVRDFDYLIPVPLHTHRQRERGFNQALLLCEGVSARTGIPVLDGMKRIRNTRPQSDLKHKDRKKNVEDAFLVPEGASLQDKHALLVDDVRTTGNTARACAKALMEAGAAKVSLLTTCVVWTYRGD